MSNRPDTTMTPRQRVEQVFASTYGGTPEFLVRAPGRVNILGGHVDYSEGFVLPGAIAPAVWLAVRSRRQHSSGSQHSWRIVALDVDGEEELALDALPSPAPERTESSWIDYPSGVAWVMSTGANGVVEPIELPALDIVMASDLPMGAGVSSSAAVEMAFVTAIEHVTGVAIAGVDKARIGRSVENEYLGVQSGIMDQYASVHGRTGKLLLIDCRHLTHREIPLQDSVSILIADTRVRRRLVGSDFNSRRDQCEQAVALLKKSRPDLAPGLKTLRDVPVSQLDDLAVLLPAPLDRRARHAVEEMARVVAGAEALERGDLSALGEGMKGSHRSSRDNYEVTIPELDLLAETAWQVEGCYGARVAGGGFGGCVLALVDDSAVDRLRSRLSEEFRAGFGVEPGFFVTRIGEGAAVV